MNNKIVSLETHNVKRLKAVRIEPNGSVVVVGGRNAQGKSSVLDSIMYALGGKGVTPKKPIRDGESKAVVTVDLGDLKVRRTFTESGGGTLIVESAEGARFQSPQSILDAMVGRLSFDPLEFSRMKPTHQAESLRDLVGVDHRELDAERKAIFDERTDLNRKLKDAKAQLQAAPHHADAPDAQVSFSDLLAERRVLDDRKNAIDRAKDAVSRAELSVSETTADYRRQADRVAELEHELEKAKTKLTQIAARGKEEKLSLEDARKEFANLPVPDFTEIDARIDSLEQMNAKVLANKAHKELAEAVSELKESCDTLSKQLSDIDARKKQDLESARFPVHGLGFDESGVLLNGVPFSQASSAEQLRVSVAMGLAINPKLRVLLVRDGSLLDADSLKMLTDMATENDAQVWIERVGDGDECSVIIEDGEVV